MRTLTSFVLASFAWMVWGAAAASTQAVDLSKIERTIRKEPAYQSKKPKYCLLVFGPEAKSRAWVVLDGDALPIPPPVPPSEIAQEVAKSLRGPLLAVAIAAVTLGRKRIPLAFRTAVAAIWDPLLRRLRLLHGGQIGDSLAWLAFGTAAFGGLCAALLR